MKKFSKMTVFWTGYHRSAKKLPILHFQKNHFFLSQIPQLVIFLQIGDFPFGNEFFQKIFQPPYQMQRYIITVTIEEIIESTTESFVRNTSLTIAIDAREFYFLLKRRKWMPMGQNGENGEHTEPKWFFCSYPLSNISTCFVKLTKACKSIILNW